MIGTPSKYSTYSDNNSVGKANKNSKYTIQEIKGNETINAKLWIFVGDSFDPMWAFLDWLEVLVRLQANAFNPLLQLLLIFSLLIFSDIVVQILNHILIKILEID